MTAELGHFALMLALGLALVQGTLPLVGAWRGDAALMALARGAARGQSLFVTFAFGCLVAAFAANDFSVAYVAANSNSHLPLYYRVAATWGGHEGSLLLWVQILALWTFAVTRASGRLPSEVVARVLAVMGLVSAGFLLFMLFASSPFERQLPAAPDGADLNPLLQDAGMIFHPPLLYMGYVGFSVAFAFAVAALLGGQLDAAWARWSRPWTLTAWAFLTLGIFLGSFWAYYELGWGGWWFWDAVENASFMPWLVGTALIHSLAVAEQRGGFRTWTVLLAILAFSLSLLGTFLVRSGVLTSVHAFATDPRRGLFILVFLALVIGGALLLFAWRAPALRSGARFALFSRESLLLVNNVLLASAAGTVLLGTLYPLVLDALGLGKISVGAPYFDAVFAPLMLATLALLGAGPFVAWKRAAWRDTAVRLRAPAALALAGLLAALLAWRTSAMAAAALSLALWVLLTTLAHVWQRLATADGSLARRLRRQPAGYWGMIAAHTGIAVFTLGVALVKQGESTHELRMSVGEERSAGSYRLRFTALERADGPNYLGARATFELRAQDGTTTVLHPEKRFYQVQRMPMTEAAIDRGFTRDLYLALGEAGQDGAWTLRLQHKPCMGWIWAGCLMIAAGGLLAAADRRYRQHVRAAAAAGTLAPLPRREAA